MRLNTAFPVLLCTIVVSCRSTPGPLAPPALHPETERYFGTSLTGPRLVEADAFSADESTSVRIRASVRWFEETPEHSLTPVEDRIERIVDRENASELLVSAGLSQSAWSGTGESARAAREALANVERAAELASFEVVLPPGVTMNVRSVEKERARAATGTRHAAIEIGHASLADAVDPTKTLRVALVFSGFVPSFSALTPDLLVERNEVIVLKDAPVVGGDPFALLFEPRESDEGGAFFVYLEAEPAFPSSLDDAALEAVAKELAACGAECAIAGAVAAVGPTPDPLAGIASLERDHRRGALARLAILHGARVCADFAAAADDDAIDGFVAKLAEARKDAPPSSDVGLDLERAAWKFLADRMSGTDFPQALAAVALEHAGEAGRFAAVLEDVAASSKSIAEIEQRFLAQNRSLLEDRSPSSRVRAFEWLAARGKVPPGYDPLGGLKERKKALRDEEDREAEAALRAVGGGA